MEFNISKGSSISGKIGLAIVLILVYLGFSSQVFKHSDFINRELRNANINFSLDPKFFVALTIVLLLILIIALFKKGFNERVVLEENRLRFFRGNSEKDSILLNEISHIECRVTDFNKFGRPGRGYRTTGAYYIVDYNGKRRFKIADSILDDDGDTDFYPSSTLCNSEGVSLIDYLTQNNSTEVKEIWSRWPRILTGFPIVFGSAVILAAVLFVLWKILSR